MLGYFRKDLIFANFVITFKLKKKYSHKNYIWYCLLLKNFKIAESDCHKQKDYDIFTQFFQILWFMKKKNIMYIFINMLCFLKELGSFKAIQSYL